MDTVQSCDMSNSDKNEKEGTVAPQMSKTKKLNGHKYKQFLKSNAKKAKESDLSILEKNNLSQSEVNVTEPNRSDDDETTDTNSSFSDSQPKRVDFLLRRVRSGHAEKNNSSKDATPIKKSKSNMACSVAYEHKSSTVTFVEYWVPVRLSNMQIEQYCGSLVSNAIVLCSSLKLDSTEVLHDMLVTARKCCDHPYVVDWSLRTSLIQGIPEPEKLNAEIKQSNKLLLLYKILLEIRKRGLRVLILYQSLGGSGPISTGDILDDIIHEKFGEESFVRIGGEIARSKRRAVLNTFNGKGSGKFVCLMEMRACIPSVKLESIDTVIFFNSDWNPMNDLRALQKINLDSQFEQVKVFRLYSSCTVEEKLLILAKQGATPDCSTINIKQSTCHGLLTWGVSYVFKRLEEFHKFSDSDIHSIISDGDSFVEEVFLELSTILPNSDQSIIVSKEKTLILEVQQIEGAYTKNISLLGEVEYPRDEMIVDEPPHDFWIKLLEGRKPRWKYFSSQSPRMRKSVQSFYDLLDASAGPETASKKRRTQVHRFDDLLKASSVGAETASKKSRTEARSTFSQIPAVIRRRTRNKLRNQDSKRKLSGGKRHALARWRTPAPGNPSSNEPHSPLPSNGQDHMLSSSILQNDVINGTTGPSSQTEAAAHPLAEDSVQPMESSVQHSVEEVPLQTASQVCQALQIELERLQKQKTEILKLHEEKKLQTKMACEEEIDQIREKYDLVLQNAETAFLKENEALETRYNKLCVNKSLAEVMMQKDNSKDAPLSQAATNHLMKQLSQLIYLCHQSNAAESPEKVARNLPTSILNDCSVVQELMNQASASQMIASESNQLSVTAPHSVGPNMDLISFADYRMRAPAPHFRDMWDPLPTTTPKLSYSSSGIIFSPVILKPVTSDLQTIQSPLAGIPLLEYR